MPITDISTIKQKLIAISFLSEDRAMAPKMAWTSRFLPSDAFWVQVDRDAAEDDVLKEIFRVIQEQKYEDADISGQIFSLAAFYDVGDEKSPDQAVVFKSIPAKLNIALGVTVLTSLQFGLLGTLPLPNADRLRRNCEDILTADGASRLFLIASKPITRNGGNIWKATALLMDVIRRDTSLNLPNVPYRVGYLKYLEHDEELRTDAIARQEQISIMLTGTAGSFSRSLEEHLCSMAEETQKAFIPKASLQPIHPNLTPTRPLLFGRNVWDMALNDTVAAIQKTGEELVARIRRHFQLTPEDSKERLYSLLQLSQVGCAFDLENELLKARESVQAVRPPLLDGLTGNTATRVIQDYLENCRLYGIYLAKCDRIEAFFSAIPEMKARYEKKRKELENEYNVIQNKLKSLPTWDQFFNTVIGNAMPGSAVMESSFSVARGELSTVWMLLCRQHNDKLKIQQTAPNGIRLYYMDENNGGLVNMDAAELKALHVMLYRLDGDILSQLIR